MKVLMAMLCLVWSGSAWAGEAAAPLQRADFAYGMELTVQGGGALYGLSVPAPVYQAATRADLGDLRVFNDQGVIPHLVRPQHPQQQSPAPVALPFFPLMDTMAAGLGKGVGPDGEPCVARPGGTDLRIVTDSSGTIIDFHQGQEPGPDAVVTRYLVDTTALQEPAQWLEFAWSGQTDHFSTVVQVEASDDLNSWRTVVSQAALAELRFAGHDLRRNRIALATGGKKYLRLSWPAGRQGVVLTAIMAGYHQEELSQPRTFLYLEGEAVTPASPGKAVYQYRTDGFFPVDQFNVRLAQRNALAQVSLFSRAGQEQQWRQRAASLIYQLAVDGVPLDSGVGQIAATTDRFWRLEIDGDGSGGAPLLELGWLPQQLVFVAQGQGPYTLAYGRAGLGPERSPVDRLLTSIDPAREKNLVGAAWPGNQIILGGLDRLLPAPAIAWRRWLLWASLVAGVLLIGTMALQLFREMKGAA
jgi:hypothetical protein